MGSVARAHLLTYPILPQRDLDLESDANKLEAKAKHLAEKEAAEAKAAERVKDEEEKARAEMALGIVFPLAQLQRECPRGMNPAAKEAHLSDEDFHIAFEMSKQDFSELPKWKQ